MEDPKKCSSCGVVKAVEDFNWRKKARGLRNGRCRQCMIAYHRRNYRESERRRANGRLQTIRTRQRNTKYVNDYLATHPCVDCGFSDIRALDFDHTRDKTGNISALRFKGVAIKRLQEEMDKCEIRCANCHRIVTAIRRNHSILDVDATPLPYLVKRPDSPWYY